MRTVRMWSPFFRCCTGNMNNLICFNVLIHALTFVDATTFVEFIKTSRQLFGTELELNVTDISRPNAMLLHLLSTCVTKADCQAVDAQQNKLLTNVSGVSATDGHVPTYISASGAAWLGLHGQKYYVKRDVDKIWLEAKADCESLGGFLATANTLNELTAALAVMSDPDGMYWLGGNDLDTEGVFTWHSGGRQTIDGTMWNPSQPDNDLDNEHCLVSYLSKLSDVPCSWYYKYMCEIFL